MKDMREQMIKVIKRSAYDMDGSLMKAMPHEVADALIANGAILPAIKIGQSVWRLIARFHTNAGEPYDFSIWEWELRDITIRENEILYDGHKIHEVFTTKQLAQAEVDRRNTK